MKLKKEELTFKATYNDPFSQGFLFPFAIWLFAILLCFFPLFADDVRLLAEVSLCLIGIVGFIVGFIKGYNNIKPWPLCQFIIGLCCSITLMSFLPSPILFYWYNEDSVFSLYLREFCLNRFNSCPYYLNGDYNRENRKE